MFRCTECKAEYAKKPDYCDCGNDLFDEIASQKDNSNQDNTVARKKAERTFFEKHPKIKEKLDSIDILSTSIFIVCIILSVLSWIFIGKESPNTPKSPKPIKHKQEHVKSVKEIPDIDTFWDNKQPTPKMPPEIINTPIAKPEEIINTPKKEEPPRVEPKRNRELPPYVAPKKANETPKISTRNKPIQSTKRPSDINAATISAAMTSYKGGLRQALFSRLAVTSIQGEGRCEIEFSIDKNGKLLNRRFSKLSDNKSLNDAVYNMLMSVPEYYPPPAGYNGEKIRLSFYFNSGAYEVSY